MGVAVHAAVSRCDVLGGAGDRRFGHDRVGVWRLVHGLEFQPLVMNPKIRWLQVFGVSLVFMGAIRGLWGSALSARGRTWQQRSKADLNYAEYNGEGTQGGSWTADLIKKEAGERKFGWASYFFWCDVVRRVHRKAPTTTTMMVKAPTEMMITMTRMWFSLLPPTPDLPREENNWIRLDAFINTSLWVTNSETSCN